MERQNRVGTGNLGFTLHARALHLPTQSRDLQEHISQRSEEMCSNIMNQHDTKGMSSNFKGRERERYERNREKGIHLLCSMQARLHGSHQIANQLLQQRGAK